MSVLLNGTNQALTGATPVTDYPFTMNVWFKHTSAVDNDAAIGVGSNTVTNRWHYIQTRRSDDNINIRSNDGTLRVVAATTTYTANVWQMATAVFTNATDRALFLNGGNKGPGLSPVAFDAAIDSLEHGARRSIGLGEYFQGYLGELGVWNIPFSDVDVGNLFNSTQPEVDFSTGLQHYASYRTDLTAEVGANLTQVGSPVWDADHPFQPGPPGDPPVPWTAWRPGVLKPCWTTNNGQDLKASSTTSLYTGGDPTNPNQIKASIVNKLQ